MTFTHPYITLDMFPPGPLTDKLKLKAYHIARAKLRFAPRSKQARRPRAERRAFQALRIEARYYRDHPLLVAAKEMGLM